MAASGSTHIFISGNSPKGRILPWKNYRSGLFPEGNRPGLRVHGVYDSQRFQPVSQITDDPSADLKSFFNGNAQALYSGSRRLHNGNQSLERAAVGKKIIDDQDMILRAKEFFGYHHL